jgi:putative sigma-54 modulation protein
MQFQFSFKHMETSEALQKYAEDKIGEKIKKYVTKPIDAQVTFEVEKQSNRAHCSLRGGDGFSVEVDHVCEDMYASVDMVIDKLDIQLKRQKEKLKSHKNRKTVKHLSVVNPDEGSIDAEDLLKFEEARRRANG